MSIERVAVHSETPARHRLSVAARVGRSLLAGYHRYRVLVHTISTLILGAIVWQLAAIHMSKLVIAPLGAIWDAFLAAARSGELWTDFAASMQGFIEGFAFSAVVGIVLGVLMALNRVVFEFLDPWMAALYSTPLIALAPLFIVIFGIGMDSRIAVVFTLAVFPVILNTTTGVRTVDPALVEVARSFGANRWQAFYKVMLPWSVPSVITGLRLAVGAGLTGVVVAEFFGSTEGLGFSVFNASQNFDTAAVWYGVILLAAIGVILIRAMLMAERWIAPWRNQPEGKN